MFDKVGKGRRLSIYGERFENKKALSVVCSLFLYYIKQIDFMLPCICSVIDHRRRQNVVRTSVTHSAIALCATFLFLPHFDVICDLLLNRRMATWNLFANYATLLYTRLLYITLLNATLLYLPLLYAMLVYCSLIYSTLSYATLI